MHREFSSSFVSKFVIEKERMYTENPCRAANQCYLTPENFTPVSKNPIIAKFFTNIGNADELGSGTRNLFKYTMLYSGKNPEMYEDDIFKITVPLDDNYSTDYGTSLAQNDVSQKYTDSNSTDVKASDIIPLSENQNAIIKLIKEIPQITQIEIAEKLSLSRRAVQNNLQILQEKNIIERAGSKKDGMWIVN